MSFTWDEKEYFDWKDHAEVLFLELKKMRTRYAECFRNFPDRFYISRNNLEMLHAYILERWEGKATIDDVMGMDPVIYDKAENDISLTDPRTVKKLLGLIPKTQLVLLLTGGDRELRELAKFELQSRKIHEEFWMEDPTASPFD